MKLFNHAVGRHRVFVRLLVPYIVFLLLAMLVGWIIYMKTLLVVEKEVTANNMTLLEQSKSILDRRFDEINAITLQLANDPRIMQFHHIIDPFAGANTFRILEARKGLYDFNLTNNFINDYYVFFKNSELVLTVNSTYSFPEFYKDIMHFDNMDYESWKRFYFDAYHNKQYLPAQDVIVKGKKTSMLTYIQTLGYPGYIQGVMAVMIDNKEIQKMLSGFDFSEGGWASIIDEKGEIVSSVTSGSGMLPIDIRHLSPSGFLEQTVGSKKMMITHVKSAYNGWTYLVVQPTHVVLSKVRYIQNITFSLGFVFLLVGISMAYVLAYRNSKPLISIVNTLLARVGGKQRQTANAYDFISEAIIGLADNYDKLQNEIKQQAQLLQAALFERLLKGEFLSKQDTDILLQHTGMERSGPYFVVILLRLCGLKQFHADEGMDGHDVKRVLVKDYVRQTFGENGYIHDAADDQIVLLYSCRSHQWSECRSSLEALMAAAGEHIYGIMNIDISFAVGDIYEGLTNVSRSYEEAKHTMQYQIWERVKGVHWFHELPREHNDYYYPGEMEVRLMNLAKAGEWDDVEKLLKELYNKNFTEKQLSFTMQLLLLCEMWGSVVKLLPQIGLSDKSVNANVKSVMGSAVSFKEIESNFASVVNTYRTICGHVNEHKKSRNSRLIEEIVDMLHASYVQSDLNLDLVADRFDVSKVYLSQYFKEQTGINFFDYLESLRMDQAKLLLLNSNISVGEIAKSVGYNSSNTFCRAFKRLNGLSTSTFRDAERRLTSSV